MKMSKRISSLNDVVLLRDLNDRMGNSVSVMQEALNVALDETDRLQAENEKFKSAIRHFLNSYGDESAWGQLQERDAIEALEVLINE